MYHYESLGEGLPVSILRIVVHIYIAISVYMHAHAVNQFSECMLYIAYILVIICMHVLKLRQVHT